MALWNMSSLINPSSTSILLGLAMAGFISLGFFAVANRPLTLGFVKGDGRSLFTGLLLRAAAGPYLLIQSACQSLARKEEPFAWLLACTCGSLAWSLLNGALLQAALFA